MSLWLLSKNYWTFISSNILNKFQIFTLLRQISDFTDPLIDPHSITPSRTSPRDIFDNFALAILIN